MYAPCMGSVLLVVEYGLIVFQPTASTCVYMEGGNELTVTL